jgi:hypothetical protein
VMGGVASASDVRGHETATRDATRDAAHDATRDAAHDATRDATPRQDRARLLAWTVGAAVLYLCLRGAGLALLAAMLRSQHSTRYSEHPPILGALRAWDAGFFRTIAEKGYPGGPGSNDGEDPSAIAFLPGYPAILRLGHALTGADVANVATVVNVIAGALAAAVLFLLIRNLYGVAAGLITVALWAAQPMSIVLSMGYSEPLFCLLAFGALLALRHERWVLAGSIGLLAGLVRAQGLALAAALVLSAAWWWWRHSDRRPRTALHSVGGTALSLLGTTGFIAWIGWRMHDPAAWFTMQQSGWGTGWDWFKSTPRQVWFEFHNTPDVFPAFCAMTVVASLFLLLIACRMKVWSGLLLYGALLLAQTLGSSVMLFSKPRLLIPVVTLLVPIAVGLARTDRVTRILATTPICLYGLWLGAQAISIWPEGI